MQQQMLNMKLNIAFSKIAQIYARNSYGNDIKFILLERRLLAWQIFYAPTNLPPEFLDFFFFFFFD